MTVYVVLLAGLFLAAVAYAGNRIGAFDPLDPPPIPRAAGDPSNEQHAKKKKHARPARHAPAGWVGQANAVCASIEPELYSLAGRVVRATDRQDWDALERVWQDIVTAEARWNERIAALGKPRGLGATWQRLLARLTADEREARQILGAVQGRDAFRYAALLDAGAASDGAEDELFERLGASRCAFEPATGPSV